MHSLVCVSVCALDAWESTARQAWAKPFDAKLFLHTILYVTLHHHPQSIFLGATVCIYILIRAQTTAGMCSFSHAVQRRRENAHISQYLYAYMS